MLNQDPNRAIDNFYEPLHPYNNDYQYIRMKSNFEPSPVISISNKFDKWSSLGNKKISFQAYQSSSIDRQIASAPNTVKFSYQIAEHNPIGNYDLQPFAQGYTDYSEVGGVFVPYLPIAYKYYIVSWNDTENNFDSVDDYLDNRPKTELDLLKKNADNLYFYTDIGKSLTHKYNTSGIKTIKSVVFSYSTTGKPQVLRWKFVTTRIYMDIPINKFPDFEDIGGFDFSTIPWPQTSPVIGGISNNSKYNKSLEDILTGGKIGSNDIIDGS